VPDFSLTADTTLKSTPSKHFDIDMKTALNLKHRSIVQTKTKSKRDPDERILRVHTAKRLFPKGKQASERAE
jgi:hypothetical protein